MRKALAIVALTASLGLLVGCAQAPNWTVKGISDVGLTDKDVSGIDGFDADVVEDHYESDPSPTDYESFPGVPDECLAVYQPTVAFSGHSTEIRLNSFQTDNAEIGSTVVFLYSDEEGAKADFKTYSEGFANDECMNGDVAGTILSSDDDATVHAEKIDPHCATDCFMVEVNLSEPASSSSDKTDRTAWISFMQRGNAVIGVMLYSDQAAGDSASWITVDQAVALVNLQAAKFDSYTA